MSIHVGLHLNPLINKMNKKLNKYIYYLLSVLIIIYGIYSFIKLNLISDMFLLNAFKYYDFNESPIIFYLNVISVSIGVGLIVNIISNKRKKEKNE